MSRIIPRFLYHFTSGENYKAIMESGFLKTSTNDTTMSGIFMIGGLKNFISNWKGKTKWVSVGDDLRTKLLYAARKGTDNLVLLRIPTESINVDNLLIRSQNRLFSEVEPINSQLSQFHSEHIKLFVKKLKLLWLRYNPFKKSHSGHGVSAKERKLYEQRKEAIEYIYKKDIPVDVIQKVGEISIEDIGKSVSELNAHVCSAAEHVFSFGTREEIDKLKTLKDYETIWAFGRLINKRKIEAVRNRTFVPIRREESRKRQSEFKDFMKELNQNSSRDEDILKKTLAELCKGQPEEKAIINGNW